MDTATIILNAVERVSKQYAEKARREADANQYRAANDTLSMAIGATECGVQVMAALRKAIEAEGNQ